MADSVLRIFSYLPNPRVWKALIAAELGGVRVEVCGDEPTALPKWLWDFDARPLADEERSESSPHARTSRRGFSGTLYKTDAFLDAHPFGTVPAAFSPDGGVGIFESNSIARAVARIGRETRDLTGGDPYGSARVDAFLDASLVLARDGQRYLLGMGSEHLPRIHADAKSALDAFLAGIDFGPQGDSQVIVKNGAVVALQDTPVAGLPGTNITRLYAPRLADNGTLLYLAEWERDSVQATSNSFKGCAADAAACSTTAEEYSDEATRREGPPGIWLRD